MTCGSNKCNCSNDKRKEIEKVFENYKTIYTNIRTLVFLFFDKYEKISLREIHLSNDIEKQILIKTLMETFVKKRDLIQRTLKSYYVTQAEINIGHRPDKEWKLRKD